MIDKNKNFAPMYDMMYVYYMQTKRAPDAERILQRKVENNPQAGQLPGGTGGTLLYSPNRTIKWTP